MAIGRAYPHAARFWQLPVFAASLGLFSYAAYLFIDPKPAPTVVQRIEAARALVQHDQPEPAIERLNALLDSSKLTKSNAATVHLLLAEALEAGQKAHHVSLEANHLRIIQQSHLALDLGVAPTPDIYRRMGESYAALEKPAEALDSFHRAIALDPGAAASLLKKVIVLEMAAA